VARHRLLLHCSSAPGCGMRLLEAQLMGPAVSARAVRLAVRHCQVIS
jgi:hypothetical protein